jgi:hypothetical protein
LISNNDWHSVCFVVGLQTIGQHNPIMNDEIDQLQRCKNELAAHRILTIPTRYVIRKNATRHECLAELTRLGAIFANGAEALGSLYLRITDLIRNERLTDAEVRDSLCDHFPPSRISELLRVATAPDHIYCNYKLRVSGFRATLERTRMYAQLPADSRLVERKKVRAAARLASLCQPFEVFRIGEKLVEIKLC